MPRLIIIALVAAVAAQAVAVPDQAAAAPVDLERDQHAELYDDKLDEAEPLLAPDHAAGLRAELDLMKEVLEEQKSVIDSLESTAAAEAALARDDPYLAVEPTREVEVSDEQAGHGIEAAAEAAEAGVTDDALGPLVARVARGPAAGEFEALARDVADFARLRTSTSEDVVDFVRWGGQGAREADVDDDQLFQDDDVTLTRAKTIAILEDFYGRAQPDKVADAGTIATRYEGFEELLYERLERQYESVPGGPFKVWRKGPPFPAPELREALHALGADRYPASPPEAATEESASLAPRGNGDGDNAERTTDDDDDVLPDDILLDDIDETIAAEAGAEVAEQAPELYAPQTRRGPVDDDDAPDDGGETERAAVDDAPPAAPLRVPDLEYNAWDDEVERAAQVGYVGPRCTDCVCRSWDGENYGECRPTTDADPCDTIRSYCVKCEADRRTPMPGLWTTHARQCERYEGLRVDDAPPARARAAEGDAAFDGSAEGEIEDVTTMVLFRAYILEENYQDYATDPAAKAAITDALVAAGVAVPGEVVEVGLHPIIDARGIIAPRVAAMVQMRVPLSTVSPSDRSDLPGTIARRVSAAVGTPRATPLGDALADVRVHRPSTPAATLRALAAALDYDFMTEPTPPPYPTEPFAAGGPPPYALPDSYPRWFKVLYRQPWILWYQVRSFGSFGSTGTHRTEFDPVLCMMALTWVVLAIAGFAVGRATQWEWFAPTSAARKEAPAPDSLAALARENHGDLAEKGMSPYVTPRGRGATARLTAAPMPVMPSPASVAEQDY